MLHRLLLLLCALCGCSALVPGVRAPMAPHASAACRSVSPVMGNNAPDGPFTPIVLAAKVVLGEKLLNKIRGKAISYHAQYITEFCEDYGVAKEVRGALVKKAKVTGGRLGFLS
jgi:hypothetical protein